MHEVELLINGQSYHGLAEARTTLADFLRQTLRLTGTHLGCEHGVCGACTVLVDGVSVRSCLMLAVQANGAIVETVEGLGGADGSLHPLQQAFRDTHGLQCGYCTPGMLMTIVELLRDNARPSEGQIREAISGNICRCTGYQSIIDAVLLATGRGRVERAAE
ncbi:(2Fe-2S)-binding protein [Microbacteriaceae bacterium K1510]|nr:(2Fe-2S)-binding protein [Microbacteriaceae bacterium K1510]